MNKCLLSLSVSQFCWRLVSCDDYDEEDYEEEEAGSVGWRV